MKERPSGQGRVPTAANPGQVNVFSAANGVRCSVERGAACAHEKINRSLKLGWLAKNVAQEVSHGASRRKVNGATFPLA
jgi:hypothetical protein